MYGLARSRFWDVLSTGVVMIAPLAVIMVLLRPRDSGLDVPFGCGAEALFTGALVNGA